MLRDHGIYASSRAPAECVYIDERKDDKRMSMGTTIVKLPFGGFASTDRGIVRRVRTLRFALVGLGVAIALLLLLR